MVEIRNSPVRFDRIQEHLTKLLNDQKEETKVILQETAQRITEENRELYAKFQRYAEEISISYGTEISAEDLWRVSAEEVQKITKSSAKFIQKLHAFQFEDFCLLTQQSTTRGYEHIKAELWLAKIKLLKILCSSIVKPFKPITFVKLRSFLCEIKDYIDSLPEQKRVPFDEQIDFLQSFLREIRTWVKEEQGEKEKIADKGFYGFIDVTELIRKPVEKQRKFSTLQHLVKKLKAMDKAESLNQKRNQSQEINSFEKIEKKMKINPPIFSSPEVQPEIVRMEESDNMHLEEMPDDFQNELLEEERLKSLSDNKKGDQDNQEKMKEFFNGLDNDFLVDGYFAFENDGLGKSKSNSLLDLFNDDFDFQKSDQESLTNPWEEYNQTF